MNPLSGIGYFIKGLRLLTAPGVKRYVIVPLLINCLLFSVAIWFGFGQLSAWINVLMTNLPDWLQWLSWVFYLIFGLLCLLVVFFSFSILANIVAAPFNELLCAAISRYIAEPGLPDSIEQPAFLQQVLPAMRNELRKLFYFVKWSVPFLILLVIPGINVIGTVLWFLYSAWMLNMEYLEYPLSQDNADFKWQLQQLRKHKILSLSFGSVVSTATLIPIANFLVMPAAIAGATAIWMDHYHADKTGIATP